MTAQTAAKIKSHWPLIVIIASIFASGWVVRETLSQEITQQVDAVEQRINQRFGRMQQDVRDIRNVLHRRLQRDERRMAP